MEKKCTKCGETKPLAAFTWDKAAGKSGHYKSSCKACGAAAKREREHANPEGARNIKLLWHYGITLEYYQQKLAEQNGTCYICRQPETQIDGRYGKVLALAVDHDHSCCPGKRSCGKCLRGLICKRCNQTLGLVNDNPEILRAMVEYLIKTW